MNTILVWFLISTSSQFAGVITYSPPMATLQECQRVKSLIDEDKNAFKFVNRCVQMTIVK
jgi:hypothetical protein